MSVAPDGAAAPWSRSEFRVPGMDCPSEERLVRMALAGDADIGEPAFDLPQRRLSVVHRGPAERVLVRLAPLGLGAELVVGATSAAPGVDDVASRDRGEAAERRTLRWVLGINAAMFLLEFAAGVFAQSTGLVADGLDMLADAAVYGVALAAVGRGAQHQLRAARLAGGLQLALGLLALAEVARRALLGSAPEALSMGALGLLALAANATGLVLVARQRDRGVHMTASFIFSASDVLANLGVIAAGVLVGVTGSRWPDLVIGAVIGVAVLDGARRILRLR